VYAAIGKACMIDRPYSLSAPSSSLQFTAKGEELFLLVKIKEIR
jgi:hypothetical protein